MSPEFESLQRKNVEALDEILGKPFKVLDDGFVRVVEYMGSDALVAQAARVSYGKGTSQVHEDRGLIRYLMRHKHTSPFEMCEIMFHVRIPMDSWRQWIRHRTANVNEYSTRYSIAIDACQSTSPEGWRLQSTKNRQGSEEFLDSKDGRELSRKEAEIQERAREIYNERIEKGIAREQARKDLPLSTYTEAYWKIDLHNLLHFLELRMKANTQLEIRSYAQTIGHEIVSRWCPIAWEAFMDYWFNAITFSVNELKIIKEIASRNTEKAIQLAGEFGWVSQRTDRPKRNYEREEFEEKLRNAGIPIPWK
jgi:thymidylate synthase (FAD)